MRRKFLRTLVFGLAIVGGSTFAQPPPPIPTSYQGMVDAALDVKVFASDVALDAAAIDFAAMHQQAAQSNSNSRGMAIDGVVRFEPQPGGTLGGHGHFKNRPGGIGQGIGGIEKRLGGDSLTSWAGDPNGSTVGNLLAGRLNRFSAGGFRVAKNEGQFVSGETSNELKPVWAKLNGIQNDDIAAPDKRSFYINSLRAPPAAQPESVSKPGSAVPPKDHDQQSTEEDDDRKPAVYRTGRLPRGLPDWFERLDSDRDGQIGLYEWIRGGGSVDEFKKYDRNDDGYITIEELMSVLRRNAVEMRRES